eukprot:Plantae.Rhodophyta-Hildenbrandia_rubra.ctg2081.p1 GENE.Plantae.Rhodophyta-Hildenbrandia_rubra.ctg2081~~Plantae.Rhodophyta-Hildenbrandia_rubra.ctg2081.p1  ORF type:complete len:334 (-),score=72.81 Plantae.Rhodophyta-Hildenbrandia_rubra.ctg2081:241-1242(-)
MFLTNLFRPKSATAAVAPPTTPREVRPHRRLKFFNFIDVLWVSDPEDIRRLEASDKISRLHSEETKDIPAVARFVLQASMWFNPETDAWFMGMEAKDSIKHPIKRDVHYQKRISYIKDELRRGYTRDDVDDMVVLLKDEKKKNYKLDVERKALQTVIGRFLKDGGENLPDEFVKDTESTVSRPSQILNPITYQRGRRANLNVIRWLQKNMNPKGNLGDNAHNTHVTTKGFSRILLEYTKSDKFASPRDFLTAFPAVKQLFRVATKDSKLENVLNKPLKNAMIPYKTIVVLDIERATKDTGNDLYMFGAGVEERQCPFKNFFFEFLDETKQKIQ